MLARSQTKFFPRFIRGLPIDRFEGRGGSALEGGKLKSARGKCIEIRGRDNGLLANGMRGCLGSEDVRATGNLITRGVIAIKLSRSGTRSRGSILARITRSGERVAEESRKRWINGMRAAH